MNTLSLFDGISCGQVALARAGITPTRYYASEIDGSAIKIAQKNFPNTIQLGDVNRIDFAQLPKIDLLIGGSPCQSLSRVRQGDGLNGKSGLFWKYIEAKEALKPCYYLLENVKMKQSDLSIISEAMGTEPILINSADFSAQNRERYYWTNIPIAPYEKSSAVILDIIEQREHQINGTYTPSIKKKESVCEMTGLADNIKGHNYNRRIYSSLMKAPTLAAASGGNLEPKIALSQNRWRKLSPLECERLQTLPDFYTDGIAKSQRYRTIGNGWTVDVIAHILSGINCIKQQNDVAYAQN